VRQGDRGSPVLIVEEVVQSDLVLDEALPFVEPLVADDVPDRGCALERLACFFSGNNQFSLQFTPAMNRLQLLRGDVSRIMRQVRIESDRFELQALHADDVCAVLALPTRCAQPVLIFEE